MEKEDQVQWRKKIFQSLVRRLLFMKRKCWDWKDDDADADDGSVMIRKVIGTVEP